MFNGAPYLAAVVFKDANYGQTIEFDSSDKYLIKIKSFGVPKMECPWIKIGKDSFSAIEYDVKDQAGRSLKMKFWFEELNQTLFSHAVNTEGLIMEQTRKIDTKTGHLCMDFMNTKPDGTQCSCMTILKKES
jgi:hypothetical protein